MLGQPLFPCTGTLDRMPSRLVHPYPPLRFTRNNPSVLSILGSRYSPTQERSICCRLVPYLHTSLSLSLSFSCLCLSLIVFWWVSRSLTDCIHFYIAFYFFSFFIGFLNDSGSVSCARSDSFVMHSASSGTPRSHTPAGNFPG